MAFKTNLGLDRQARDYLNLPNNSLRVICNAWHFYYSLRLVFTVASSLRCSHLYRVVCVIQLD